MAKIPGKTVGMLPCEMDEPQVGHKNITPCMWDPPHAKQVAAFYWLSRGFQTSISIFFLFENNAWKMPSRWPQVKYKRIRIHLWYSYLNLQNDIPTPNLPVGNCITLDASRIRPPPGQYLYHARMIVPLPLAPKDHSHGYLFVQVHRPVPHPLVGLHHPLPLLIGGAWTVHAPGEERWLAEPLGCRRLGKTRDL